MAWYNNDWSYRKKITLSGATITGNHVDFPFLFHLDLDTDLSSNALSDGTDLIFTDSDEVTRVHYEIENYCWGSGNIWVRAPTLTDKTDKELYVYYGEGTDHTSDAGYLPSGVWDTHFVSVLHFHNGKFYLTPALLSNGDYFYDSTTYGATGSVWVGTWGIRNSGTVGITGPGIQTHDVSISSATSEIEDAIKISPGSTWECWAGTTKTTEDDQTFYAIKKDDNDRHYIRRKNDGTIKVYQKIGGSVGDAVSTWNSWGDTNVHHVVFVITGASNKFYWDGTYIEDLTTEQKINDIATGFKLYRCARDATADMPISGHYDEFRLSNVKRNAGWISNTYSSIRYPSKFLYLDSEESAPVASTYTSFSTPTGEITGWVWNSGQFNTASGMRATSASPTTWDWVAISSSANYFYPSGTPTAWLWISGSVGA